MRDRREIHRSTAKLFSSAMLLIGVALIVRTIVAGGGAAATGTVLGALFVVAGAARLYVHTRR
jgi:hypothetical protein